MQGKEQSVPRIVQVSPGDHQNKLTAAAQEAGADYRFSTFAERLITDSTGKVVGVADESGTTYHGKNGVVLATGRLHRQRRDARQLHDGPEQQERQGYVFPGHTVRVTRCLPSLAAPTPAATR